MEACCINSLLSGFFLWHKYFEMHLHVKAALYWGGRAGLTSRWPRRGPGGGLGARPSRTQRRAAVSAVLASRPSPASHVRSSAPRASRRSRAVPQGHGCPCFSLPGAFCFLNHPCLSFSTCLWPDTNCCKFCVTASLNF